MNTSKPLEHPLNQGGKLSKRLVGENIVENGQLCNEKNKAAGIR